MKKIEAREIWWEGHNLHVIRKDGQKEIYEQCELINIHGFDQLKADKHTTLSVNLLGEDENE